MLDSSKIRTRKLYYEDAYKTEFTAKIVSANAGDIVLDRTAFFSPFSSVSVNVPPEILTCPSLLMHFEPAPLADATSVPPV